MFLDPQSVAPFATSVVSVFYHIISLFLSQLDHYDQLKQVLKEKILQFEEGEMHTQLQMIQVCMYVCVCVCVFVCMKMEK